MNKKEFMVLMDAMRSYYPREKLIPTKEAAELWYDALKDLEFDRAMTALQEHVQSNKWSPTIADIRQRAVSITRKPLEWSDGWGQTMNAIRKYGYMNEKQALDSMDDITREVVKRLNWGVICTTEQDDLMALRANFRMIYEQIQAREDRDALLTVELKEKKERIAEQERVRQLGSELAKALGMDNGDDTED